MAPWIIAGMVLVLHLSGYAAEQIWGHKYSLYIWLAIACIDAHFGFKCGRLLQTFYTKDRLTGLANRELFAVKMTEAMSQSGIVKPTTSLIMVDIDDFKTINERYGVSTGDNILKEIASILRRIEQEAVAIRWEGEEFAVILPEANAEIAAATAEDIRATVERTGFLTGTQQVKVTVSVGVVTIEGTFDIDTTVKLATEALDRAKETRNRVVSFAINKI